MRPEDQLTKKQSSLGEYFPRINDMAGSKLSSLREKDNKIVQAMESGGGRIRQETVVEERRGRVQLKAASHSFK